MAQRDEDRMNTWVENDILRKNICLHISEHPHLSSNELAKVFGMSLQRMQHQVRKLVIAECIQRHGPYHKATYTRTDKEYETKYSKEDLDKGVGHSRASSLQELIATEGLEFADKDTRTVVKVNSYTTIYLNSKKPVAKQVDQGKRKTVHRGIGSSMAMFGNW